jgi:hypothetical protein
MKQLNLDTKVLELKKRLTHSVYTISWLILILEILNGGKFILCGEQVFSK